MSAGTKRILTAGILTVLVIAWWLLLVTAGIHGSIRGLFHPRVYSRALGAAVVLVPLASWYLFSSLSGSPDGAAPPRGVTPDTTEGGKFSPITARKLLPLLIPLLLVPAAIREPTGDRSSLDFTPGGGTGTTTTGSATPPESPLLLAVERALEDGPALEGSDGAPEDGRSPDSPEPVSPAGEPGSASSNANEVHIAETGTILIEDENYARLVDLIWDDPRRFAGRTVEMVSFVFRRPRWPETFFTAARLSIWCCLVDAAVIGVLVETDPRSAPREEEWIRVRGTLGVLDSFDTGTIVMERVPVLRDASWEVVPKPDFEYVFPADW